MIHETTKKTNENNHLQVCLDPEHNTASATSFVRIVDHAHDHNRVNHPGESIRVCWKLSLIISNNNNKYGSKHCLPE